MPSTEKNIAYFKRLGKLMSIVKGKEVTEFYAFLQPLRYKNKLYLGGNVTELRHDNTRKFLIISPPEPDVSIADGASAYISADGRTYCVDHSETVFFGNKPLYRWSVVHIL